MFDIVLWLQLPLLRMHTAAQLDLYENGYEMRVISLGHSLSLFIRRVSYSRGRESSDGDGAKWGQVLCVAMCLEPAIPSLCRTHHPGSRISRIETYLKREILGPRCENLIPEYELWRMLKNEGARSICSVLGK